MTQTKPALTPPELVEHPQLAAIELLRTALNLSRVALLAAHPELTAEEYIPGPNDDDVVIAEHVLSAIDDLLPILRSYRKILYDSIRRRDDLDVPF